MKYRYPLTLLCAAALLTAGSALAGEEKALAEKATTEKAATETVKPKVKQCEMVSGTRIRPRVQDDCKTTVGPMRSYTQEDLQRTGEIDISDALRKLDPIFH